MIHKLRIFCCEQRLQSGFQTHWNLVFLDRHPSGVLDSCANWSLSFKQGSLTQKSFPLLCTKVARLSQSVLFDSFAEQWFVLFTYFIKKVELNFVGQLVDYLDRLQTSTDSLLKRVRPSNCSSAWHCRSVHFLEASTWKALLFSNKAFCLTSMSCKDLQLRFWVRRLICIKFCSSFMEDLSNCGKNRSLLTVHVSLNAKLCEFIRLLVPSACPFPCSFTSLPRSLDRSLPGLVPGPLAILFATESVTISISVKLMSYVMSPLLVSPRNRVVLPGVRQSLFAVLFFSSVPLVAFQPVQVSSWAPDLQRVPAVERRSFSC